MLKVWGRKSSSNVQVLLWCISELNLDYERIDAGFIYGVVDSPEHLAMNPNGTIPTLVDSDNPPFWETGAILRYLANSYAPDSFWPADPIDRTEVDMWAEWSKINIALRFTAPIFWRVVRTPPSRRGPGAIRDALRALDKYLGIAEAWLAKHPFLVGESFTLADIQFGHCLYRYFDIDIERTSHPSVRRYYDALTARPSFREHVMVCYEELRERD